LVAKMKPSSGSLASPSKPNRDDARAF
jgi:hypothetical protein